MLDINYAYIGLCVTIQHFKCSFGHCNLFLTALLKLLDAANFDSIFKYSANN